MKKIKGWKHNKQFDTTTLITLSPETADKPHTNDTSGGSQENAPGNARKNTAADSESKETRKALDLKDISDAQNKTSENKITQIYEPRPLTPDDDIYEDIIEQFASAPTKPKYWFEEFGSYWSCSCGHLNKGKRCISCGLERDLLRSLFILHKPAGAPGKLNRKLNKAAKEKIDQEEKIQSDIDARRRKREASGDNCLVVVPIETDDSDMQNETGENSDAANLHTADYDEQDNQSRLTVKAYQPASEDDSETELENDTDASENNSSENVHAAVCIDLSDTKKTIAASASQNENTAAEACSEETPAGGNAEGTENIASDHSARIDTSDSDVTAAVSALPSQSDTETSVQSSDSCALSEPDNMPAVSTAVSAGTNAAPPAALYKNNAVQDSKGISQSAGRKKHLGFKAKILIAIIACMLLIGGCGTAIYYYMAAPAMQYQDAQDLQARGKYAKAIEKYKSLGDYKNCKDLIWQCYCGMADKYFEAGEYNKAIDTYNIAIDLKDDQSLHDKIWNCYIAIGDQHLNNAEYEKALSTYYVAADLKDNEDVQAKINLAKFTYVKAYQADRTAKVEEYMSDLMAVKYTGIQEIYDAYYAWHIKIVANTSETDNSTDVSTVSRKDTVYFHASLSGGEPSEQIMLYYEVAWPGGESQIYNLDSSWKSGAVITARFQYPMPIFGKEGKLTFKLYDKSTNELLGSDTVTFEH